MARAKSSGDEKKSALTKREGAALLKEFNQAVESGDCAAALRAVKAGAPLSSDPELWEISVGIAALMMDGPEGEGAADREALIDALLVQGAPLEGRNYQGSTALMRVALHERLPSALYLLSKGANPLAKNQRGACALYYAMSCDSELIMRALVAHGADGAGALKYASLSDSLPASEQALSYLRSLMERQEIQSGLGPSRLAPAPKGL